MLQKFQVKNFKNFKDWFVYDLTDVKDFKFNTEAINNETVFKSIIYGHNGCGKTNLGQAIFDIKWHLMDEKQDPSESDNYQNVLNADDIVEFKYQFKFGDIVVDYAYGKQSPEKLVYEVLLINDKEVLSLDRRKSSKANISLPGAETLNRDLSDSDISVVKYVHGNAVLSRCLETEAFKHLIIFVKAMLLEQSVHAHMRVIRDGNPKYVSQRLLKNSSSLRDFERYLNDFGVTCKLTTIELDNGETIAFDIDGKKLNFFSSASTGTRCLTELYIYLEWVKESIVQYERDGMEGGPLIFIDEFNAFYHHEASKQIVRKLRDMKCQVILTTHNTDIMTNEILRPDCYFVMTELEIQPTHRLTQKDLRLAHNLEKMYKAGAFENV